MDSEEAGLVLEGKLRALRASSYAELMALLEPQHLLERGPSGTEYRVELQAFWDDPRAKEDLRVMVTVRPSQGAELRFGPLTDDFIRAPDGRFIGE
jgi:hypothetical protein